MGCLETRNGLLGFAKSALLNLQLRYLKKAGVAVQPGKIWLRLIAI